MQMPTSVWSSRIVSSTPVTSRRRRPGAGSVVVVPVVGTAGVPEDATGVMVNLTAADPSGSGYLTAYPCNAGPPTASNLNVRAGVNRANFVLVAPDADGEICVFTSTATDVVVDLLGWVGDAFVGIVPTACSTPVA